MLGKAVVQKLLTLESINKQHVLTPDRKELNLEDLASCLKYFERHQPEVVFHLAAKVMGLQGNLELQAESLLVNSQINNNLFQSMVRFPPKKIFFAGTAASYSYPYKVVPLREDEFMMGDVHDGEFGYAWSKRFAYPWLRILRDEFGTNVVYGILTNLFGPNDRFQGRHTHVIPALIHRASNVHLRNDKCLEVWGFPTTTRDFLSCVEAARIAVDLVLLSTLKPQSFFVNIGSGIETSMRTVAEIISREFNIERVIWRHDQPIGVQRRYLDISKLSNFAIQSNNSFETDLIATINWYKANSKSLR